MSTITRPRSVTAVPVRRLDQVELRKRLAAVEQRLAIVGMLLASWKPYGKDARANYRALRQELRADQADPHRVPGDRRGRRWLVTHPARGVRKGHRPSDPPVLDDRPRRGRPVDSGRPMALPEGWAAPREAIDPQADAYHLVANLEPPDAAKPPPRSP